MDETQTLGGYLRAARQAAGMNQWDVAHAIDNDQAYISKIERGVVEHPAYATVVALARAVAASPETALRLAGYPVRTASGEEAIEIPLRGAIPVDRQREESVEGVSMDEVRVLPEDVSASRSPLSELYALLVVDDCLRSFGPWRGDVVIVEPAAGRTPRDRQLVVVRLGGKTSLWRWRDAGLEPRLEDGDGRTVARLCEGDDYEVLAFYVTFKPTAPRQ